MALGSFQPAFQLILGLAGPVKIHVDLAIRFASIGLAVAAQPKDRPPDLTANVNQSRIALAVHLQQHVLANHILPPQSARSGDRTELIQLYATLFPVLEATLPTNFRGYVKGDLLYMNTPPEIAGNYVFRPNTVEYKIPARSSLGQRIGNSNMGIAVHSMYADAGDARQPLAGVTFNPVPGLMLERPATPTALAAESTKIKSLKQLIQSDGAGINTLFNPAELKAHKITDLAKLCVDYINTKVGTPLNPATLLPEFGEWLKTKVTAQKFRNIVEYLESPTSNTPSLAAAFTAFIQLHDLKMDILKQADLEHPGQEGWVMATPAGYSKAVGRFDSDAFTMVG